MLTVCASVELLPIKQFAPIFTPPFIVTEVAT